MTEHYNSPVALGRCKSYDTDTLRALIESQFRDAGITEDMIRGKKVVIKPNLVTANGPEAAATTHPAMLEAVVSVLREYSPDSLILAESPGGPYTEITLKNIYRACGILGSAEKISLPLNYDTSFSEVRYPSGTKAKTFNIITPITEADVIVNLCKLKTHSLMKMTCAVKNFFGVIPGIQKFEMHAKFSHQDEFAEMLVDLCSCLMESKTLINVCDGILAMEGNGPSAGIPRMMDLVMTSLSPFAIDVAAEHIIGFDNTVLTTKAADKRGILINDHTKLHVIGDSIDEFAVSDFIEPDSRSGKFLRALPDIMGGKLATFFEPRPKVNHSRCVGCGRCAKSCPVQTIKMITKRGKKKAKIEKKRCIRCYCCQELCPYDAVDTKQNILIKIVH